MTERSVSFKCPWMLSWSLNAFSSHLGVFLISVKPLTIENTEKKTSPKNCKITARSSLLPETVIMPLPY